MPAKLLEADKGRVMAGKIKYTREQRQQVYDLFWMDRGYKEHAPFRKDKRNKGMRMSGKYSCREISEMTGVHPISVEKIAKCEQ